MPYKYETDLAEYTYTVLEDRFERTLCHTNVEQTWQSTLPHEYKTDLAEYSVIQYKTDLAEYSATLLQNRLDRVHSIARQT